VTALLRRLHSVDFELPALAPTACAERYLARIGGSSELTAADRERYAELLALADLPWSESACLCHNDLTADNVLLCEQSWLIDFDYAVAAAPVLDLASLAVMNDFDRGDCQALLESYYGGPPPIPAEEFARVQRLVRLLAHFWALASGQAGAAGLAQYRINHD
jgi:thiamine kinase-like enzyme